MVLHCEAFIGSVNASATKSLSHEINRRMGIDRAGLMGLALGYNQKIELFTVQGAQWPSTRKIHFHNTDASDIIHYLLNPHSFSLSEDINIEFTNADTSNAQNYAVALLLSYGQPIVPQVGQIVSRRVQVTSGNGAWGSYTEIDDLETRKSYVVLGCYSEDNSNVLGVKITHPNAHGMEFVLPVQGVTKRQILKGDTIPPLSGDTNLQVASWGDGNSDYITVYLGEISQGGAGAGTRPPRPLTPLPRREGRPSPGGLIGLFNGRR